MSEYPVNRGIGKPVEFKGLKSQYLFIFCGGLLAVFVVFIVLFMAALRKKLERGKDGPQYIQTHIGIGYRMLRVE